MGVSATGKKKSVDLEKLQKEVLTGPRGSSLPSALSDQWLMDVSRDLDRALAEGEAIESADESSYMVGPLALVLKILCEQRPGVEEIDVPLDEMKELMEQYSLELSLETVSRFSGFEVEPVSLEDIFSKDREIRFKRSAGGRSA